MDEVNILQINAAALETQACADKGNVSPMHIVEGLRGAGNGKVRDADVISRQSR